MACKSVNACGVTTNPPPIHACNTDLNDVESTPSINRYSKAILSVKDPQLPSPPPSIGLTRMISPRIKGKFTSPTVFAQQNPESIHSSELLENHSTTIANFVSSDDSKYSMKTTSHNLNHLSVVSNALSTKAIDSTLEVSPLPNSLNQDSLDKSEIERYV